MNWLCSIRVAYKKLSLSTKVFVWAFVGVALPSLLLGIGSHVASANMLERDAYQQAVGDNKGRAMLLNERLRNVITSFNRLLNDGRLEEIIQTSVMRSVPEPSAEFDYVSSHLANFERSLGLVRAITIHTDGQVFYDKDRYVNVRNMDDAVGGDLQALRQRFTDTSIVWAERDFHFGQNNVVASSSISILMTPFMPNLNRGDVVVSITIDDRTLEQYLAKSLRVRDGRSYIVDGSNEIIVPASGRRNLSNDALISSSNLIPKNRNWGSFQHEVDNNQYVGVYASVSVSDWSIVTLIPRRSFAEDTRFIFYLGLGFLCIGIIVAIFLSFLVYRNVNNSLTELHYVVDRVRAGDLHVRYSGRSLNEVGDFGRTLNKMLDETQKLIHEVATQRSKVEREHRLKLKAELKALEAQVNPHFLYNTLNAVYWKGMLSGNRQVADLAVGLSRFFRMGLNRGSQEVTLSWELQLVRTYLEIQKVVYSGRFDYRVEIAEGMESVKVLRFTLQPLVENSLFHGLADRAEGGFIGVYGEMKDEQIVLTIEDNGSGFSVDEVSEQAFRPDEDANGHAIHNICRRLQIFFGNRVEMYFYSTPYVSNTVSLVTPAVFPVPTAEQVVGE